MHLVLYNYFATLHFKRFNHVIAFFCASVFSYQGHPIRQKTNGMTLHFSPPFSLYHQFAMQRSHIFFFYFYIKNHCPRILPSRRLQ